MATKPISIAVLVDASKATSDMDRFADAINDSETQFDAAARASSAWASKAEFAGQAASQLAGGLGDVAGGLVANGIISEEAGAKIEQYAAGLQAVTGAVDIATTASSLFAAAKNTEAIAQGKAKVAMVASKVALIAGAAATGVATAAQWLWNAAMTANPIGLIIAAIVILIAIIVVIVKKWPEISAAAKKAWDYIWDKIKKFWEWLKGVFSGLVDWFKGIWEKIKAAAVAVWDWIWTKIQTFKTNLIAGFGIIKDKIVGAWNTIKDRLAEAIQKIKDKAGEIVQFFKDIPGKLLQVGKDIMQGLVDGLQKGWQWVKDKIAAVANLIPDGIKDILGMSSPSKVMKAIGANTVMSLNEGMQSQLGAVKKTIGGVASTISGLSASPTVTLAAEIKRADLIASGTGSSASGAPINLTINFSGLVTDPAEVGRKVVNAIESYQKRSGRIRLVPSL